MKQKNKKMKYTLIATFLLFVFACTPKQQNEINETKDGMAEMTEELKSDAKAQWAETKREGEVLKEKIDYRIALLEKEIEESTGEAKIAAQNQKAKLEKWQEQLERRLENFGDDIAEGWRDFVNETNEFFDEVERSIDS